MLLRILFFALLAFSASGFVSPPLALSFGLFLGLVFSNPYPVQSSTYSKLLLKLSVVGLGFSMNLQQVLRAGRSGFLYTLLGIVFALSVGMALGWLLMAGIRRPLGDLAGHFEAIAAGDMNREIPRPAAREFWQVVNLLRAMRARLAFTSYERTEHEQVMIEARKAAIATSLLLLSSL